MNEAVKPPEKGEAKFHTLGASSGFEGDEVKLGAAVSKALTEVSPTGGDEHDFTGREEALGLGVSTIIKTLNHTEVYPHDMNDALVKMILVHIQFAKKHGLSEQAVQDEIDVTSPMMKKVGALINLTENKELALVSIFDHTPCFFHLVEKVERREGFVRYKSPYNRVLHHAIPGQFDLTEEEVHEIWTKPRYHGYAEILGVEFKVSDMDEDGYITVEIV